jgi:hypothetical protein
MGTESGGSYKIEMAELPKDDAFGVLGFLILRCI